MTGTPQIVGSSPNANLTDRHKCKHSCMALHRLPQGVPTQTVMYDTRVPGAYRHIWHLADRYTVSQRKLHVWQTTTRSPHWRLWLVSTGFPKSDVYNIIKKPILCDILDTFPPKMPGTTISANDTITAWWSRPLISVHMTNPTNTNEHSSIVESPFHYLIHQCFITITGLGEWNVSGNEHSRNPLTYVEHIRFFSIKYSQ